MPNGIGRRLSAVSSDEVLQRVAQVEGGRYDAVSLLQPYAQEAEFGHVRDVQWQHYWVLNLGARFIDR